MKPNPGVQGRAARDTELEEIPRATIDAGRAKLAQKVVTYGQLKRGKSGGLNDKQMQELLVDVSPTTTLSVTFPWSQTSGRRGRLVTGIISCPFIMSISDVHYLYTSSTIRRTSICLTATMSTSL